MEEQSPSISKMADPKERRKEGVGKHQGSHQLSRAVTRRCGQLSDSPYVPGRVHRALEYLVVPARAGKCEDLGLE